LGILISALALAGCSMPSEKYGLAPVKDSTLAYPNINLDPAAQTGQAPLDPQARAAAQADLEQRAGQTQKPAAAKN
jgi:hypothetical protein